ncbi:hypothetical protein [Fluviispira vulneris]|uniref:hypothetical protein n=1 Tax=Fluviispira vulneris TaxID=2763012 RepID=UPI001644F253|nr:hypothetical protein [Fluviispira vulneris]
MAITDGPNSLFISSQSKSSSRVGNDILAYCNRCKMNLTHTIVTCGANNKPEKVLCNTCKSEKLYRSPKSEAELAKGGTREMERDEEQDLDLDAGAKRLTGDDPGVKKKSKSKAKARKKDDSDSRASTKSVAQLPLSMQAGTSEDIAQFEARLSAQKNNVSQAKEYKASVRFKTGEILNHKSFGIGFVVAESGLNKIEVLFSKGRKLLATGLGQ